MSTIRTAPRTVPAEFVRQGDEIALYQIGGKHTPAQVCDCPKPDGRKHWHCAMNWNFAQSKEFVEENPASIMWAIIGSEPQPAERQNGFFSVPAVRLTIVPILAGAALARPVPIMADVREPAIVRERLRITSTEGQPTSAGVTADMVPEFKCAEFEVHGSHYWEDAKHCTPGTGRLWYCNGFGHPVIAREERQRRLKLVDPNEPAERARLHALDTIDVTEVSRKPGENTEALVMRAAQELERVGVAVGRKVGESESVDFHSVRDSE